ncbi:hypothetical protein BKG86_01930 [Mycobacteroides chelonae]|nr:hypothetical protein BKG86_01930 [Mycobacteroides chelonae]
MPAVDSIVGVDYWIEEVNKLKKSVKLIGNISQEIGIVPASIEIMSSSVIVFDISIHRAIGAIQACGAVHVTFGPGNAITFVGQYTQQVSVSVHDPLLVYSWSVQSRKLFSRQIGAYRQSHHAIRIDRKPSFLASG